MFVGSHNSIDGVVTCLKLLSKSLAEYLDETHGKLTIIKIYYMVHVMRSVDASHIYFQETTDR